MLGVSSSEVTISVLILAKHINRFAVCTPRHSEDAKTIKKLDELTEKTKSTETKLHAEEPLKEG